MASLQAVDHVPGDAVVDHLGHRAVPEGQHGRAAGHRLDHGEAERLRPVDGEEKRARFAEELDLAAVVDLADELDAGFGSAAARSRARK